MKKKFWTNDRGTAFEIQPVPTWLREAIKQKFDLPQPPTYTVNTVGGGETQYNHTEKSIVEIGTDGDKAKWQEYLMAMATIEGKLLEELITKTVMMGLVDVDPSAEFVKQIKLFGINPDNDEQIRELWLWGEVAPSDEEKGELFVAIQEISGYDEVMLSSIRASFRLNREQKRTAAKELAEKAKRMERTTRNNGTQDNESVGDNLKIRMVQPA